MALRRACSKCGITGAFERSSVIFIIYNFYKPIFENLLYYTGGKTIVFPPVIPRLKARHIRHVAVF